MIGASALTLLAPGAVVIAVSRGGVVDEKALIRALKSRSIYAAGLDVFEKEPLPNDSPLIGMKNVVLSPHIGANTFEAFDKVSMSAAEKMIEPGCSIAPT